VPTLFRHLAVRLLRASRHIDRAYLAFNRRRSRIVVRHASEGFLDAYNAATYRDEPAHREGPGSRELRPWEVDFIRSLPPPPARVLLGGAGTGREAQALAARGYQLVAFDPAASLVASMRVLTEPGVEIEPLVGGYLDLPLLRRLDGTEVDLTEGPRFQAAYAGWASFSHLRKDADCVDALMKLAALSDGPILLSYLPGPDQAEPQTGFSVQIGFFRQYSEGHIRDFAAQAGLEVVSARVDENWPRAVLRRRKDASERSRDADA